MKKAVLTAVLAAGVLGASALPSLADSISVVNRMGNASTVSGSNTADTLTFIATGTSFGGSLTENQTNFSLIGASFSGSTPVKFTATAIPLDPFSFLTLSATGLVAGDTYTLTVDTAGTGIFGGTLTGVGTVVSSVPLPTSVAMFGVALVGLGAVGFARKGGKVSAAA